jgi:hypothetical protein
MDVRPLARTLATARASRLVRVVRYVIAALVGMVVLGMVLLYWYTNTTPW